MQDLAALQEEINKAMAETNDTTAVAKRASEQPAGVQGIRSALDQPDDLLAKHPEYMAYAAATAATGTAPISALRCHLQRELATVAADVPQQAAKRPCTSNSPARNTDADGDTVI